MQKGLGIAALALSIIAIFIPFIGSWLTVVVAGLAAFAFGPGFALGVAGIIINALHIFFFSPLLWATSGITHMANEIARSEGASAPGNGFVILPWMLVAIQVAALVFLLRASKRQPVAGK